MLLRSDSIRHKSCAKLYAFLERLCRDFVPIALQFLSGGSNSFLFMRLFVCSAFHAKKPHGALETFHERLQTATVQKPKELS